MPSLSGSLRMLPPPLSKLPDGRLATRCAPSLFDCVQTLCGCVQGYFRGCALHGGVQQRCSTYSYVAVAGPAGAFHAGTGRGAMVGLRLFAIRSIINY